MTDNTPAWVKNFRAALNDGNKYIVWIGGEDVSNALPEDEAALQAISKMNIHFCDKDSRL